MLMSRKGVTTTLPLCPSCLPLTTQKTRLSRVVDPLQLTNCVIQVILMFVLYLGIYTIYLNIFPVYVGGYCNSAAKGSMSYLQNKIFAKKLNEWRVLRTCKGRLKKLKLQILQSQFYGSVLGTISNNPPVTKIVLWRLLSLTIEIFSLTLPK